ncbi:hypothetical protein PTTG_11444, partial [Puccinia triticina 1-1 BBBD Race 1]
MHPVHKHKKDEALSTIDQIKQKLLAMTPAQLDIQLAAINRLLEGTGTVIDVKLPTEAQKTRGRPKGAPNKSKSTRREPSEFEHVEKKRKNEKTETQKTKKVKFDAAEKKKFEQKKQEDQEKKNEDQKPKRGRPPTKKSVSEVKKPVKEEPAKKRLLPARKGRSAPPKEPDSTPPPPENALYKPARPPPTKKALEKPAPPKKTQQKPAPPKMKEESSEDEEQPAPKKKWCPMRKNQLPPSPSPPPPDAPIPENEPPEDNSLIRSLPFIIQDSVSKVLDVDADGHCGFRAVAWALGRGQDDYKWILDKLIDEINNHREWYVQHQIFHNIDSFLDRLRATPGFVGR